MIELSRDALIKAIEPCARVADQRSSMPALAHVLLESDGKRLGYRATNLRHEISGALDCEGPGSFAVNARDMAGALAALSGDSVKLDLVKDTLTLKSSGKRAFRLPTLPAEEFPVPMNVGGNGITLPAGLLQRLISGVAFAARTDLDRAEQCVVRLDRVNGKLRAATTNGLGMLAMFSSDVDADLALSIPLETTKLLLDHDSEIVVTTSGNAMAFDLGDRRVASSQPAGTFPPVDLAVQNCPTPTGSVVVQASALLDSVKAVRRACNDVCLRFGGSSIVLESTDANSASDEVDVSGDAQPHEAWLLADQLCGALGAINGEVTVEMGGGELAPIKLTQGGWSAWLMPMRAESVKAKRAA